MPSKNLFQGETDNMATMRRTGSGPIAAIGRACFAHRWWVLVAWLVIAAGGFSVAGKVFDRLSSDSGANSLESIQGYNQLSDRSQIGTDVMGEVTGVDPRSA